MHESIHKSANLLSHILIEDSRIDSRSQKVLGRLKNVVQLGNLILDLRQAREILYKHYTKQKY